ncbi:type II toxin-antitoxin system RelE/ParE family toxin [Clostridium sp.]|jgi:phage-related protein|uniref:type II toxin-antitoxin system RelE/ParE family toxin n=1 Tax=Clostridia TaxID=186801 RepID=UPI00257E29C1|nr:type II toxin-antitoxin system RelE/ParE family toxin [Clostridium sp.]MBS4843196.1 type II toxin-antitoxin system RelE/ParE family toxin [Clostridium sp.]MDU4928312.1 type II toxin-antitoxin system RelE/ParE family toxin [Clostridium sp.]
MYNAIFYTDVHGNSPVKALINSLDLSAQTNKKDKLKLNKVIRFIDYLELFGTRGSDKVIEHIQGKIWQIRPGGIRIFLFHWKDDKFVLLHSFDKKTQKTPVREIDRAIREMNDWISRYGH